MIIKVAKFKIRPIKNSSLIFKQQHRFLQTVEDYNSLIDSALQSCSIPRVENALKEMKDNNVELNNATRNLLIEFANQNNNTQEAFEQYQTLKKKII